MKQKSRETHKTGVSRRIFALGGGFYGEHRDTYAGGWQKGIEEGADYYPWDTSRSINWWLRLLENIN